MKRLSARLLPLACWAAALGCYEHHVGGGSPDSGTDTTSETASDTDVDSDTDTDSDSDTDTDTSQSPYNIVFVTSVPQDLGDGIGGVEGADGICAGLAGDAGLNGVFMAWLATSAQGAHERIAATGAMGWVRRDGRPVVNQLSDLTAGYLYHPPRLDENGDDLGRVLVATGTYPDGTPVPGLTCGDWFGGGDTWAGYSDAGGSEWTHGEQVFCSAPDLHLYCFEVDHDAPVVPDPADGRVAFLSSAAAANIGLAGADALCQSDADSNDLFGTFKALLCTSGASAVSRFDTDGDAWVRVDDIPVSETAVSFFNAGSLLAAINLTADGTPTFGYGVWTGCTSLEDTSPATDTCQDWGSASPGDDGITGAASHTSDWFFDKSTESCDTGPAHLICLEDVSE